MPQFAARAEVGLQGSDQHSHSTNLASRPCQPACVIVSWNAVACPHCQGNQIGREMRELDVAHNRQNTATCS